MEFCSDAPFNRQPDGSRYPENRFRQWKMVQPDKASIRWLKLIEDGEKVQKSVIGVIIGHIMTYDRAMPAKTSVS